MPQHSIEARVKQARVALAGQQILLGVAKHGQVDFSGVYDDAVVGLNVVLGKPSRCAIERKDGLAVLLAGADFVNPIGHAWATADNDSKAVVSISREKPVIGSVAVELDLFKQYVVGCVASGFDVHAVGI
jgi:hypothetical protein